MEATSVRTIGPGVPTIQTADVVAAGRLALADTGAPGMAAKPGSEGGPAPKSGAKRPGEEHPLSFEDGLGAVDSNHD